LFCPGDRPDRYPKAIAAADAVIIDLEDAVAPANKDAARNALLAHALDPARVIVRVNAADSAELSADLAAVRESAYRTLMLAKTETAGQIEQVAGYDVIALIETPRGVLNAVAVAADPSVIAMMWGAEDLVAAMGGQSSRHPGGQYRDVARHARSSVLLSAHAHGCEAVDSVYIDIHDLEGLSTESLDAAASGFAYKACIHPNQADVVRAAFKPTPLMRAWAQRILDQSGTSAVSSINGQMIDAPLIKQARRILRFG
jgi:citrate lyase subunit beta/citryl-CoA lyase